MRLIDSVQSGNILEVVEHSDFPLKSYIKTLVRLTPLE